MALTISASGAEGHHVRIGDTDGRGLPRVLAELRFQLGPIKEVGVNGIRTEDLLRVCLDRLVTLQAGKFPSGANGLAIEGVRAALEALKSRTRERESRGG